MDEWINEERREREELRRSDRTSESGRKREDVGNEAEPRVNVC